jgi:hypothetical protein
MALLLKKYFSSFHPEGQSVVKHCVTTGDIWYTHRSHKHTHTYPLRMMYCLCVNNYRHDYNPKLHFISKRLNIHQISLKNTTQEYNNNTGYAAYEICVTGKQTLRVL